MKRNYNSISRLFSTVIILFLFCSINLFSQTPGTLNYQAVLRDNDGNPRSGETVSMQIVIHQTTETGTEVYTETHNTTTTDFGIVNLEIGSDDPVSFDAIDWSAGPYFIEVIVNGTAMGVSELLTVPYALYAEKSATIEENSVGSLEVIDNSLTIDDLGTASVGSDEVAENSLTDADIAAGAVGTSEIANQSILAEDILEQPGIAQDLSTSTVTGFTNAGVTTMATTTVTIPGPGYIFITARALVRFDASDNTLNQGFVMQIDDTEGGYANSGYFSEVYLNAFPSTGIAIYDQTATGTFYRGTAGTYSFYFEGMLDRTNRTVTVYWPVMTAIYIPVSVGTVDLSGSAKKGIQDMGAVSDPTE